ncbi:MAG: acylneuraminate cytidylyltransferase family protein [bacterium]
MKVLCVIPARGGSKRFPGKNLMPISGKPVISYTIQHALNAKFVDRIVVSTDSDEIAEVAHAEGAAVIMRPPEISNDTAPIEDALRHVVYSLKKSDGYYPDIVVLPIANIVYRRDGLIDEAIQKLIDNPHLSSVITVFAVTQPPEWMKRIEGDILVPYMKCDKYRQQDLERRYLADGSVCAIRIEVLMDTEGRSGVHVFLGENIGYLIQEHISGTEIDHPEDVLTAEVLLEVIRRREAEKDKK